VNPSTLRVGSEASRLDIEPIMREHSVASILRLAFEDSSGLSATVHRADLIPEHREAEGLVAFFEDIAGSHWTGWSGAKTWANLEHNLAVEATWRRTGGATLRVTLVPEGQRWKAQGTIEVADMELERLGPHSREVILGFQG
jgi:hypothetical protein